MAGRSGALPQSKRCVTDGRANMWTGASGSRDPPPNEEQPMVLRREPTARQVRLGTELRRLREAAGLTAIEAAALLGANRAQMSHIESGLAGVSEERLRRLASHYACTDKEFIEAL